MEKISWDFFESSKFPGIDENLLNVQTILWEKNYKKVIFSCKALKILDRLHSFFENSEDSNVVRSVVTLTKKIEKSQIKAKK